MRGQQLLDAARRELTRRSVANYRTRGPVTELPAQRIVDTLTRSGAGADSADDAVQAVLLEGRVLGTLTLTTDRRSWLTAAGGWPTLSTDPVGLLTTWLQLNRRGRRAPEQRELVAWHCADIVCHVLDLGDEDAARAALPAGFVAMTGQEPSGYRQVFDVLADVPARAALTMLKARPTYTSGKATTDPVTYAAALRAALT